ncbi:hypothetical protein GCM10010277_14670 [Streptomyces longisporoflavus]|uniref:hypothetical protein n=1 Tax=Streptomyces longisporoflavus TaxID=28044 RepID=UPI00167C5144|nr:hypothetical protein [Streptomyces longisporoflavus]GGV31179.1 hypothetical protein GCM10010277_14670 [Streptomyces longisporoflavus]
MTYRISYAPPADDTLAKMARSETFKAAVERTLGVDPYGHGSIALGKDADRREATIHGVFLRYYVSGSILTVTVVRLIPAP